MVNNSQYFSQKNSGFNFGLESSIGSAELLGQLDSTPDTTYFQNAYGRAKRVKLELPTSHLKDDMFINDYFQDESLDVDLLETLDWFTTEATQPKKESPGQNTQWSELEETFLVAAVMDWFFRHGSLTPARKKGAGPGTVWTFIKEKFDTWLVTYANIFGRALPHHRSSKALSRHYKTMKTHENPRFYQLYKTFVSQYEKLLGN